MRYGRQLPDPWVVSFGLIVYCCCIQVLNLDWNALETIPDGPYLRSLETLELRGYQLLEIPEALQSATALQFLEMERSQLSDQSIAAASPTIRQVLSVPSCPSWAASRLPGICFCRQSCSTFTLVPVLG